MFHCLEPAAVESTCFVSSQVFIGRPAIWGLAHNGEEGVSDIVSILKMELDLAMALSGTQFTTLTLKRVLTTFVSLQVAVPSPKLTDLWSFTSSIIGAHFEDFVVEHCVSRGAV